MPYRSSKSRTLMPRLLAVVSCAIAILAAQPAASAAPAKRSAAISVAQPSAGTIHRSESVAEKSTPRPGQTLHAVSFFTSARNLHILATVEILKRLLLAELAPATQQFLTSIILAEPLCLGLVNDLPTDQRIQSWEHLHISLPDRQFAIEHCLLAPPIA